APPADEPLPTDTPEPAADEPFTPDAAALPADAASPEDAASLEDATPPADAAPPQRPDAGGGQPANCDVPSEAAALLRYLRAGEYKGFQRESAPHASSGPHGGRVLTYVNDLLADSLDAGAAQHPRCAASIKELFLGQDELSGWAVLVKTEDDTRHGNGYYWLEVIRTDATSADYQGHGLGACVGCHSTGRDYFRAPWPLQ
ncbi:MAG TPA: hypothetical protein VFZ61_24575, partial [Polyangiales bacterium]